MGSVRSDPRRRRRGRWLWIPAAGVSAAVTAAAVRRLALVRATTDEKNAALPGDELVDRPTIVATRGIDIAAPPEAVWPWVAQLGQERGGFYTYAWLENLVGCRMVNADRINPQWQDVSVGDIVRLHPDLGLRVAVVEPGRTLALTGDGAVDRNGEAVADPGYDFSWTFTVTPTPAGCRLLTRERYRARTGPARVMTNLGVRLSTIMSEGMLRGIRDRAQRAGSAGGIGRRSTILT